MITLTFGLDDCGCTGEADATLSGIGLGTGNGIETGTGTKTAAVDMSLLVIDLGLVGCLFVFR